jgi:hypothetical protein
MPAGRKPEWPAPVRAAIIHAVFVDGQSLNGAVRTLKAGNLGELGKIPLPLSTARSWVDTEKRQRARAERPDVAAWSAAADRFWRVIGKELDKIERESRKAVSLEPKRLRDFMALLREARDLIHFADPRQETQPEVAQGETEPATLLESLTAPKARPATSSPPTKAKADGDQKAKTLGGSEATNEKSGMGSHALTSDRTALPSVAPAP